ncbi:MAG: pyrroline-5-carboxylate reductase [Candidatus Puniceispirillaceae bacterium]
MQHFYILGCGKMGSALLEGWLARHTPYHFIIIDPYFNNTALLAHDHVSHFADFQAVHDAAVPAPDVMLLSVKPQMMQEALGTAGQLDLSGCCFISIAAGLSLAKLAQMINTPAMARIIRTMPNTPAAIGKGITALIGNEAASAADLALACELLSACGEVVQLSSEGQLDAVTALSGSGPAYVFYLAEVMRAAGEKLGLPADLAQKLADQTVYGAGALLIESDEPAGTLRENVTSKGGTTAAALSVLMSQEGMAPLFEAALRAAHDRSEELGR